MSELQAAIGLVQLKKLPNFIAKRTNNAKKLTKLLLKEDSIELPIDSFAETKYFRPTFCKQHILEMR